MRKRVIECVLSTDMSMHSKLVANTSTKVRLYCKNNKFTVASYITDYKDTNKFDLQQEIINLVVHSIDIGHAAKPFELELKWADLVTLEFHNQGDIEKSMNLPISFLCDRTTSNLPASQVGFISGIVLPIFELVELIIPKSAKYVEYVKKSKEEWEKLKK